MRNFLNGCKSKLFDYQPEHKCRNAFRYVLEKSIKNFSINLILSCSVVVSSSFSSYFSSSSCYKILIDPFLHTHTHKRQRKCQARCLITCAILLVKV